MHKAELEGFGMDPNLFVTVVQASLREHMIIWPICHMLLPFMGTLQ